MEWFLRVNHRPTQEVREIWTAQECSSLKRFCRTVGETNSDTDNAISPPVEEAER